MPLRELARLLVPVACPGCGALDVRWCAGCAALFAGPPRRVERDVPRLDRLDDVAPLPVWALARYDGAVRGVVVAWKDRGRADLDELLVPAAARGAQRLRATFADAFGHRPLLVVPAPSSAASRRTRGREHLLPAARAVAQAVGGVHTPVLRRVRGSDQVGLGARARGGNVAVVVAAGGLARAVAGGGRPGRGVCMLVDDVVTTGATLAAAERALEAAGVDVAGAFVLATTPPPGDVTREGSEHDVAVCEPLLRHAPRRGVTKPSRGLV